MKYDGEDEKNDERKILRRIQKLRSDSEIQHQHTQKMYNKKQTKNSPLRRLSLVSLGNQKTIFTRIEWPLFFLYVLLALMAEANRL